MHSSITLLERALRTQPHIDSRAPYQAIEASRLGFHGRDDGRCARKVCGPQQLLVERSAQISFAMLMALARRYGGLFLYGTLLDLPLAALSMMSWARD